MYYLNFSKNFHGFYKKEIKTKISCSDLRKKYSTLFLVHNFFLFFHPEETQIHIMIMKSKYYFFIFLYFNINIKIFSLKKVLTIPKKIIFIVKLDSS